MRNFSAGLKSADDFKNISSLRDKKGDWEASVQEAQKTEKLTQLEQEMFEKGRVKGFSTKYDHSLHSILIRVHPYLLVFSHWSSGYFGWTFGPMGPGVGATRP